jgi:hypothetical protein
MGHEGRSAGHGHRGGAGSRTRAAGELLRQQAAALAVCLEPHQGAGSGIAIEGEAPADPALEHSVENLDH